MPVPKKRLVITKDHGVKTEAIPHTVEKSIRFAKSGKTKKMMKFMQKESDFRRKRLSIRARERKRFTGPKYQYPKGATFKFKRIETLVKNKHSQMKHSKLSIQRRNSPVCLNVLRNQLRGIPVLLVVRLHSNKNIPEKLKNKMVELRLFQAWDAVLIRNTPSLLYTLRDILSLITFGVPSRQCIRDMVLKRGRLIDDQTETDANDEETNNNDKDVGKVDTVKRSAITSNIMVEKALSKYGVICVEDVIDALASHTTEEKDKADEEDTSMGSKQVFEGVANALNPFQLNRQHIPMRGLQTPFDKMGYWGFRGTYINTFVEKHM